MWAQETPPRPITSPPCRRAGTCAGIKKWNSSLPHLIDRIFLFWIWMFAITFAEAVWNMFQYASHTAVDNGCISSETAKVGLTEIYMIR
jgi:hypothetical protein